ncbi:MAG: hypothetical protein ACI8ZN_001900 [Bacteroidia bacterium]
MFFREKSSIISILLFFALAANACAQASCDFLDKYISIEWVEVELEEAVKKVASQEGIKLNYPNDVFAKSKITSSFHNRSIRFVLSSILRSQQISFSCLGSNSLVLFKRVKEPISAVRGIILDQESKTSINGALAVHGNLWVESNSDGYFQLYIDKWPTLITIYHPGYYSKVFEITNQNEELLNFELTPNPVLNTAVIHVFDSLRFISKTGSISINMREMEKIPSIAGSPGVLNTLRFVPGLQSTVEVNGGMVVRGGGKDQNLVLFDGMDLYNPMHLFGLFSVFGEGCIQSLEFYKNAFPAKYGGRLSSVLDVHSRPGDFNKWRARINFNPVLFEATVEGPLIKDRTSILLSGRRSFTDFFPLFYEQIQSQNQLQRFKYFFYDVTGTIRHKLSDNSQMYLTTYIGGDKGYIRSNTTNLEVREEHKDEFIQANFLTSAGWKTWLTSSLQLHVKLGYTRYNFNHKNLFGLTVGNNPVEYSRTTELDYSSTISDWKSGVYFESALKKAHAINFGIENIWHQIRPSNSKYFLQENDLIFYDTVYNSRISEIQEQRSYVELESRFGKLKSLVGLHVANFDNDTSFLRIQPRVSLSYAINSRNRFELSYAKTAQFIISVPNNLIGIPIDIWVPADRMISPQQCHHYSIGYSSHLKKELSLKADVFYKDFEQVVELKSGIVDFVSEWENALWTGNGRSFGMEFMMKKEKGKLNGWASYCLSKSERSIAELNEGEWFPFQFDRRHDFNIVVNYEPSKNVRWGATWTYASGHYLTAPETQYVVFNDGKYHFIQQYGGKNNLKVPAYHRLDIGVHFTKMVGEAKQTWSFSLYNAYDQNNVFYVNSVVTGTGGVIFQPISILPILPSINYAVAF